MISPAPDKKSSRSLFFSAVYSVFLVLAVFGAGLAAARDDGAGALSLHLLTPIVELLVEIGRTLAGKARAAPGISVWCSVVLSTLTVLVYGWRRVRGVVSSAPFGALFGFFSLAGAQSFLLLERWDGAALAALIGIVGSFLLRSPVVGPSLSDDGGAGSERPAFGLFECATLAGLTLGGIALRFYGLNRIADSFEGELSPYMVGATSLRGMLLANIGWHGPWAPLGILYYLPMHLCFELFGVSVLSVRLSSAIVSAATIPLLYLLIRSVVGGPTPHRAALLAAAFVAIDPLQVGWGRSDQHPHGSTTWITILVCWLIVRAIDRRSLAAFLGCAFLMGLSWHQYPSGQFAVLIPLLYGVWLALNRVEDGGTYGRRGWLWVGVGCAAWLIGWPLEWKLALGEWRYPDRFAMLGPRFSMMVDGAPHSFFDRVMFTFSQGGLNIVELLRGLTIEASQLHHQDLLPSIAGLSPRTAAPLIVISAVGVILFGRRRPEWRRVIILLLWIMTGSISLVLSDSAYPKRGSTIFPALIGCGAIGLVWWGEYIGRVFGRWCERLFFWILWSFLLIEFCIAHLLWFSGDRYRYGEPLEYPLIHEIKPILEPGTIIVPIVWDNFLIGKLALLLIDDLKAPERSPLIWAPVRPDVRFEDIAADPVTYAVKWLPESMWYRWSALDEEIPALERAANWKEVVYIAQVDSFGKEHQESLRRLAIAERSCKSPRRFERKSADPRYRFVVLHCQI